MSAFISGFITWWNEYGPLVVWFAVLGGIALGLFIANEISSRRFYKRQSRSATNYGEGSDEELSQFIPFEIRDGALLIPSLGIENFPSKKILEKVRPDISEKLYSSKEIYASFFTAGKTFSKTQTSEEKEILQNIKKLILPDPRCDSVQIYKKTLENELIDLPKQIIGTKKEALKLNIPVRWCPIFTVNLLWLG